MHNEHNEHNELRFNIKLRAKILVGGFEKTEEMGENARGKFDCTMWSEAVWDNLTKTLPLFVSKFHGLGAVDLSWQLSTRICKTPQFDDLLRITKAEENGLGDRQTD